LADLVSIVIPTRNRARLLGQALRSARGQSWREREIVVVDEASGDDTPAMLARDFPEVRVLRHGTPLGPAGARNAGVAAARGNWVFFWDDDDLMHPGHLAALAQAQRAAPPDTLISGRVRSFTVVDGDVRLSPVACAPAERSAIATLEEFIQPHRRGSLTLSTILWPTALCRAVPWDEKLLINEDVDFFGRALLAGYRIAGRPTGMMYIRQHEGERASTNPDVAGVLAPALYRLKWTALLADHPEREAIAPAMRDGLMAVMIELSARPDTRELLARLDIAFRQWGGRRHYVTPPPRNPVKRWLAQTTLDLGGLAAVKLLLASAARLKGGGVEPGRFQPPLNEGDREDADILRAALFEPPVKAQPQALHCDVG
jgi:glycosyltransferase involved in cell wall biosynthesis